MLLKSRKFSGMMQTKNLFQGEAQFLTDGIVRMKETNYDLSIFV